MTEAESTFRLHEFIFYGKGKDDSAYWVYGRDIRCTDADAPGYADQLARIHQTHVYYMRAGFKGVEFYGRIS